MREHEVEALLHASHAAGAGEMLCEGEEEGEAGAEERGGGEGVDDLGGGRMEETRRGEGENALTVRGVRNCDLSCTLQGDARTVHHAACEAAQIIAAKLCHHCPVDYVNDYMAL